MAATTNADGTVTVTGGDCCCTDPCSCPPPAAACVYLMIADRSGVLRGPFSLPYTAYDPPVDGVRGLYRYPSSPSPDPDFSPPLAIELPLRCAPAGLQFGPLSAGGSGYNPDGTYRSVSYFTPGPVAVVGPPCPAAFDVTVTAYFTATPNPPTPDPFPFSLRVKSGACGTMSAAQADGRGPDGGPQEPDAAPCRHRSAGPERRGLVAAAGLNPERDWYRCLKPGFARRGLLVSECGSCGVGAGRRCGPASDCPGYDPAAPDAAE